MRFLVGTLAMNRHVQNVVRMLSETDALGLWWTGLVDRYRGEGGKRLRRLIARVSPTVDRELGRRAVKGIPDDRIRQDRFWELLRLSAARLRLGAGVGDRIWERAERNLAGRCAGHIRAGGCDAFFGVEHGALEPLLAARDRGLPAVVAFLSPHALTRARWVDVEYDRFPELRASETEQLLQRGVRRDARRDREAQTASIVHTNSVFTKQSLVDAGVTEEKIYSVPLGMPDSIEEQELPEDRPVTPTFVYAGPVSVRKGAHYLLDAWRALSPRGAELHFYGEVLLPRSYLANPPGGTIFHGSIPHGELLDRLAGVSALVLPTLCDGYGMVVNEALSRGCPAITTTNAGAADVIREGEQGFVVPPASAEALADRLEWCLSHPDELHAMRPRALETARTWTWADYRRAVAEKLFDAVAREVSR